MENKYITSAKLLENKAQLKWMCRRGMLELDVLLGNFLQEAYSQLSMERKSHFVNLLACSDPEIYVWLIGREIPDDKPLADITEVIRQHARSRIHL